ncbi:MAG: S9 family peptidase, partial [Myxococcota bacterium]
MTTSQIAAYGSWKSPLSVQSLVVKMVRLGEIVSDGPDIYWSELRPSEGGRVVVVRRSADGAIGDVTPAPFNVRTRVHEYGGRAFTVHDGVVYFSNFADQRLYAQRIGEQPRPLTADRGGPLWRYGDGIIDAERGRMICIREDHSEPDKEASNTVVAVDLATGDNTVLTSGNDFYAAPRLDPSGTRLAWMTWNHPNMPWDDSELWVAEVAADGTLGAAKRIAGGTDESVVQPLWAPDGSLVFASDRSGWWNLYRWRDGAITALAARDAEFAGPLWTLGQATYGFDSAGRVVCAYSEGGQSRLARLGDDGQLQAIDIPYTAVGRVLPMGERVLIVAGSPSQLPVLAQVEL